MRESEPGNAALFQLSSNASWLSEALAVWAAAGTPSKRLFGDTLSPGDFVVSAVRPSAQTEELVAQGFKSIRKHLSKLSVSSLASQIMQTVGFCAGRPAPAAEAGTSWPCSWTRSDSLTTGCQVGLGQKMQLPCERQVVSDQREGLNV